MIQKVLFFFFCCFSVFGQEFEGGDHATYREDQFYFGTSLVLLDSNLESFNPRGISRHFQWGVVRDYPLTKTGKIAAGIGLGMAFERYTTNLISTEKTFAFSDLNDALTSPLFLSVHSLELPLSFRWRSSTATDFSFWRIYGGVALQYHYRKRAKQEAQFFPLTDEIQNFGTTAHLSFGYNTWNFYLAYQLNPIFTSPVSGNASFQLIPLKIGLIFYLL